MERLTEMIKAQHELQKKLGCDPLEMDDEARMQYIKDNVLALMSEMQEMMNEVGWKPWASSRHINSDAAFGELRDAWQFMTNLMIAVTGIQEPAILAARLEVELYRKHNINYARAANDYDGVSTKCPICGRAADEYHLAPAVDDKGVNFCYGCGATWIPIT